MINIFILVLNWNRFKDTKECLVSIRNLELPKDCKLSVVVIDNNSDKKELDKFEKTFSNLFSYLLKLDKNYGFSGGNNAGVEFALENKADYIMILNNDTLVDKKLLVSLFDVFKDNKVAAVSPKIYFAKGYEFHKDRYDKSELGKVIWYAGGKLDWNNIYGTNRGVDEVDRGQYNKIENTDFVTGSCFLFRCSLIVNHKLFNNNYFMYLEDLEMSQRFINKGFKILYNYKGVVWHKVARSSGIGSNLNDYYITRNRLLFGMRHASIRTRLALYKESLKFILSGRPWQKRGVIDYYLGRLGKGSWK